MNCLNNSADTPQQDFALVVRNGFLDRGMTPADLFLILDGGSASPAAPQDDHYAPGSSDHDVLDDPLPPAAGPEPGAGDGDGASGQAGDDPADDDPAVDDWWREDDELASETVRPPRSLPGALRAAAAAGMSLAQGAGNLASNGADPPDAVVDLEIALARLDRTWAGYDATRRRAAVLTVGDATRVTSGAIDILRRLAFRGELWILSTTPSILRFLAQRVHRRHGVRYRLCEPGELAGALRDTLAIAAGLQRLITHGTRGVDRSLQVSFAVVPDDLALVIRVQGPGVSQLQLQLKDGHGQSMLVGAADAPPAIQVMPGAHGLELRRALGPQDAGTWTLVVPPEAAERAGVMVYARTRLGVRALATDTGAAGSMVSVKGGEQSRLGKLQLDRRLIDGAAKGSEQRRLVEVAARTSRIDARGKAGEAPREALVPSLGAFLAMPPAGSGARVLDLRISARGVRGRYDFGRLVHADLVSLERRSVWRARLAPQAPVTLRAQVSDIQRDDGGVAALTLRRGAIGRRVRVRSPALRTALRDMDFNNPSLLFTVRGHELVSVVTQVRGASMRYKVRRSMGGELGSLAGLEPPVPMVETAQCDYAGASRFVQAKHFQAKPNGRTISRVVIHITDGGANIEGTIGWFKNPVAKNGTEVPVSAHYVVGQDGQVVQMVREQDVAYHANAANGDSIGIEHCARSKKALSATDPGLLPTETQYAASAALVRDICKRHGIPLDRAHVLGHNEADTKTTHKGCPTNAWDWTYYVDLLLKAPPAPAGLDTGTPTAEPAGGGEPTDTTEEPTDTTEEPTDTTEEPTDTTEEPTDTTEEPTDTTEEPTDTTEEPTDTTEEPIDTGEEPTDTTEEPIDTGEEPAEPEIESSAEYLRALAEHIVRRAARIPQGPDLEPSAARFAVGARFSNAADIDQWFQARMGHGFIDWFNTTCAGKEAWANAAIGTPAADPAALQQRFAAIWDRIPQMFGTPSITLLHFASLMTLMITEAGTDLLPASEPPNPANAKRAAGIAALFDAARSRGKASYNVAPNRTAYDLFHDPVFLGAHRQLPFGDVLANTADTRWKGVSYPAGDYPVSADPSVDGFILQADFFKFRGRGLVKITGRSEYYELIAFVQGYAGPEPTISRYRQAWAGRTADEIATTSRTEHWDELFQQTYFDIPCAAIRLHSTAHGNYLNLADDTAQLNAVGPGSFGSLWHMGWQVGRSRAYADLFKRRVVALLHTLAQGAGMSVRSEADRLRALAIDQAAPVRRPLSSAILIPQKTVEPYHGRDPRGVLGRRVLRPDWINGTVPFIPTPPVPKLGEPVVAGDFLLFPDPNNGRTFYTLARPVLRRAALVVYISRIESEGGTSYGVTSANASITVAVYADGDPTAIEGYRQQWIAALVQQGMANADATRFLPLRLRDLKPSLVPSPQEAGGEVQALTALDAGTITFTVPLNSVGALVWQQLFTTSQGYRLGGTCSIEASYFAQADTNLQVDTRVLSCTLGTLLAAVRPEDVTVVNPQQTVPIQVLVSPYSLVDSVSVDVLPSEGASAQALAFTSEGGQVQIPITSSNLAGVRVSYNATVRFKPTGWRVITQKGSLALPHEWDINVNPDSWVTNYNVCAIVLDAQNKVTSGAAADLTDIFTVRLDYSHPALSGPPLSLVFQTASQEMVSVPFPWPPDSLAPPTLTLTVFGQRQGAPVGPVTRVLSYDETQIVIKVYINGAIECFTNKTPAGETSIESELMRVLEHVH
jgi:N-acetyl-anhydromuramyl-L-alanine amidase AmpD